jgi:hypothetical protein
MIRQTFFLGCSDSDNDVHSILLLHDSAMCENVRTAIYNESNHFVMHLLAGAVTRYARDTIQK